jgi:hypothetical protein
VVIGHVTVRKNHNTIPEALKRQVDGVACNHQAVDRQLVNDRSATAIAGRGSRHANRRF